MYDAIYVVCADFDRIATMFGTIVSTMFGTIVCLKKLYIYTKINVEILLHQMLCIIISITWSIYSIQEYS